MGVLSYCLSGSCFSQPKVSLLKPKGKSLPNVFYGSSYSGNTSPQTAIASRSLSTLTDRSKKSKNISKGASGDEINTSGEKSYWPTCMSYEEHIKNKIRIDTQKINPLLVLNMDKNFINNYYIIIIQISCINNVRMRRMLYHT